MDKLHHRQLIENIHLSILQKKERIKWLRPFNIEANRLFHVGCDGGIQTIALMWEFNASEVVGIDIDHDDIDLATQDFGELRKSVKETHWMITNSKDYLSQTDLDWWSNVPIFIRETILDKSMKLEYICQDIRSATKIQSDYYDLIFCDFVLHHISSGIKKAACEIHRIAKRNGRVAAYELVKHEGVELINLETLFYDVGLEMLHKNLIIIGETHVGEFLFYKS